MNVKISVIVPVYNVEKYLDRSLASLCKQTLKEIEIICIDDCSTDNSLGILNKYAEKDTRIKVISLDKNSGAAIARNKGLEIAQGEYLGFMDSDDEIDPDYYEKLYNKAITENADLAKAESKTVYSNGTVRLKNNDYLKKHGKYYFIGQWWTAIYKHSIVQDNKIHFPTDIIKAQDTVFLGLFIVHVKKMVFVDGTYYYYYRREDSLDTPDYLPINVNKLKSALKTLRLLTHHFNEYKVYEEDKKAYLYFFLKKFNRALVYSLRNNEKDAKYDCAQTMTDIYDICVYKKEFQKMVNNKKIIKYIRKHDIDLLLNHLNEYNSINKILEGNPSFIERIFSIKKNAHQTRYSVYFLGFHINFRLKCHP